MKRTKDIIISILVLVGFFSAAIGMYHFSDTNPAVSIFIFGTLFFVFGVYAIVSGQIHLDTVWLLIFPVVGFACMAISATHIWDFEILKQVEFDEGKLVASLMLLLFFIVGAALSFGRLVLIKKKNSIFTYELGAECIDTRVCYDSDGHRQYKPILRYYYNEKEYIFDTHKGICICTEGVEEPYSFLSNGAGQNSNKIGRIYPVKINPENPVEAWRPDKYNDITLFIVGLAFMGMSLISFYYLLFK